MILLGTIPFDPRYGSGSITVEADPRDGELYITQADDSDDGGTCVNFSPRQVDGLQQALGEYIRQVQK